MHCSSENSCKDWDKIMYYYSRWQVCINVLNTVTNEVCYGFI